MKTAVQNKLLEIIKALETAPQEKTFEFNTNNLSLEERESLRFQLMSKGIKALLYTELRQNLLGVWI